MKGEMSNETKRRLFLSRWRGVATRSEIERRLERLLNDVDTLNNLVGKLNEQDDKIETLEADLKAAREKIESLGSEQDEHAATMESALVDVKYWMHDGLVLHKGVRDPRPLLRKIEDALR